VYKVATGKTQFLLSFEAKSFSYNSNVDEAGGNIKVWRENKNKSF
jgi:hypothetical protein